MLTEAHRECEERNFMKKKEKIAGEDFSLKQDSLHKGNNINLKTQSDCWGPQRPPQRDVTVERSSGHEGLH